MSKSGTLTKKCDHLRICGICMSNLLSWARDEDDEEDEEKKEDAEAAEHLGWLASKEEAEDPEEADLSPEEEERDDIVLEDALEP
jgi:hypothetical protein